MKYCATFAGGSGWNKDPEPFRDKVKRVFGGEMKRFEPPSEQEVAEYMVTQHDILPHVAVTQASRFIGFYESKNWYVGRNKMKSWKGAVRNWVGGFNPDMLTGAGKMKRAAKADQLRELQRGNAKM